MIRQQLRQIVSTFAAHAAKRNIDKCYEADPSEQSPSTPNDRTGSRHRRLKTSLKRNDNELDDERCFERGYN